MVAEMDKSTFISCLIDVSVLQTGGQRATEQCGG